MLDMDTLSWDQEPHRMKVERNLNFATLPNDEDDFGFSRKKTARDPMSHRIIEKRRRDRMNNCLADLSRLVPTNYLKKGRGRIEKTEIIEMAIKHLKHLQAHPCKDPGSCEVAKATEQDHRRQFRQGFQECMSEAVKFMMEGSWMGDGLSVRLLNHLQKHYDKIAGGACYTQALNTMDSKMEADNNHNSNGACFPPSADSPDPHHSNGLNSPFTVASAPESPVNHIHPSRTTTSQLREMLQNPGVPRASPHHTSKVGISPAAAGDLYQDSCYKFKNTIKHRFNADLSHRTEHEEEEEELPKLAPPPLLRCASPNAHHYPAAPVAELTVKIPPHWDSPASSCSNPSPPPPAASSSAGSSSGYSTNGDAAPPPLKGRGVPVFALHPRGAFYVPLTIEAAVLPPHMTDDDAPPPTLHPVSICVNFAAQHKAPVQNSRTSSFLMDKFHERFYYPCPSSPTDAKPANGH